MTLKEAIEKWREANSDCEKAIGRTVASEAASLVLDSAEKWDAQMWYWNMTLGDSWQYFPFHSDCRPTRDEILEAYRKATGGAM